MTVQEAYEHLGEAIEGGCGHAELVAIDDQGMGDMASIGTIKYIEELYLEGGGLIDEDPRTLIMPVHFGG